MKRIFLNICMFAAAYLFTACGPSLKGVVVLPDGSQINDLKVVVYTQPWTDSVPAKSDGSFSIGKNVKSEMEYTLIAEDKDGNLGFVKNYKPAEKKKDEKIVIKLSKEIEAKEAVIEGDVYINQDSGPGEKIFKSSQ